MDQKQTYWEERLGSSLDSSLLLELDGPTVGDDPSIFVYMNKGPVEEVRPASSVWLTSDEIVVGYGEAPVASFARKDVYFCSKKLVSPF
jgi:hypothetical protein